MLARGAKQPKLKLVANVVMEPKTQNIWGVFQKIILKTKTALKWKLKLKWIFGLNVHFGHLPHPANLCNDI